MQKTITTLVATTLASSLALLAVPAGAHSARQLATVQEAPLRAHLKFLSSDQLEGRGTGQRGGELAVAYLEAQVAALGLKPANGSSYRQPVKIAGQVALPKDSSLSIEVNGAAYPIAYAQDWVWAPGDAQAEHSFDTPLVFVGYGITAAGEGWDDYKDFDCKGKIAVSLVNDPKPTAAEPNRFAGKSMTYNGRWIYKFEEAARHNCAGILLIHTDESASYPFSVVQHSWIDAERFRLADGPPEPGLEGWMTDAAARALFKAAGQDLDTLRAAAEVKGFKPVPLNAKLKGVEKAAVRFINENNVAAIVPGTDPKLKDEVVIYSAHWDHLGKHEGAGDQIFNGAVDNASGSAGLLAMAEAAMKAPARRSQMFLWVAAEEQGLLGSSAYANAPLWQLSKTAANLNLDSLNWVAATRDIGTQGSERTELAKMAAATAKAMGMGIAKAEPDLGGGYFRSDHFSFAKVGVPAFSIEGGHEALKDQAGFTAKAKSYDDRYHQASDEYDPSWDLAGMLQQTQFTLNLGRTVADAPKMPAWNKGDPFGAARAAK